jgi:S-(hydroxymethyl)glutathione dehydrogenase / alcohol dehydrogenase
MPRAAVCHRFGEPPAIEDVRLDPPAAGEVRVRVSAVAICHSDLAYAAGAWGGSLPAVYGHEACGTVAEVGPGAAVHRPGDRVVVSLVRHCGECARCNGGEPALCGARFRLDEVSPIRLAGGARAVQGMRCGAFADEVVVHCSQAVAVPAGIPDASACVIACAAMTGIGAAVHTAQVPAGAAVAVVGAGGVGLNAVQGAVLAGAGRVIALDVAEPKLAAARAFGAGDVVDASGGDPAAEVRALTGGGADVAIVTAASGRAFAQGLDCLRRGGTLVVVGMPPGGDPFPLDAGRIAHDGIRILGSKLGSARPREDVRWIAELYLEGRVKLDELVTATYPLERIDEAAAAMRAGAAIRNVIVL